MGWKSVTWISEAYAKQHCEYFVAVVQSPVSFYIRRSSNFAITFFSWIAIGNFYSPPLAYLLLTGTRSGLRSMKRRRSSSTSSIGSSASSHRLLLSAEAINSCRLIAWSWRAINKLTRWTMSIHGSFMCKRTTWQPGGVRRRKDIMPIRVLNY